VFQSETEGFVELVSLRQETVDLMCETTRKRDEKAKRNEKELQNEKRNQHGPDSRIGKQEQHCQNRTSQTCQPEQDSQNRTARTR
jgi:hypothetical protein